MNTIDYWLREALAAGFDTAEVLDPKKLHAREDIREMCAGDRCGAYGKNWTCPPACGTLEQCQTRMRGYSRGILLQTVGHMRKDIDSRVIRESEKLHLTRFSAFCEKLRSQFPEALCLGAGGCRVCSPCAWPEPCRFPEKAMASMEGYGLFVTQVCRDTGVPYHHGDRTVTFTACILF